MTSHRDRAGRRVGLFAVLIMVAVLGLVSAPGVQAAPPAPTMDLAALEQALESGPLAGHMLTTMKGTTPEEIPVQVESLIDYSWGTLILFEALGPKIEAIGGIAAGMSGSPVYVEDGGVDKLIGAVSYGDSFTLNGMGLATPIEYMAAIEDSYPIRALSSFAKPRPPKTGVYRLSRPASGPGGNVTSVVVAPSVEAASQVDAAAAQTVMAPLGILEIGGAKPGSAAFEAAAAKLAGTGLLIKAAPGDGTWAGAPAPALEGGSPCAILFSQGAVWVGAAGTVTFVDGDTALLFGHPFEQLGAIDAALTGGNVEGVWASSLSPYKLISPQDVKGTCVQDRRWGVAARLDQQPDFFPVSTTVTGGKAPVSDSSSVSEWLVTSQIWPELPGDIAGEVALRALDQSSYPGSAETTTTVVVSDPTGTYTVEQDDLWTSPYNAAGLVGMDAGSIVWALVEDPDGVLHPRIESVTVDAALSPLQRSARIADVTLPNGIATGDNLVRIAYYRYGSDTLQTTDGTLTIPEGMDLFGRLRVTPPYIDSFESEMEGGFSDGSGTEPEGPPQTLDELVAELNAEPSNSDLLVSFTPMGGEGEEEYSTGSKLDSAEAVIPTGYVFSDSFSASTARLTLQALPRKVPFGGAVRLSGMVLADHAVPVGIYRQDTGAATATLVTTVTATPDDGVAVFAAEVQALKRNATLIARVGPLDGSLPGSATAPVKVSARVTLSGTSRLTVTVRPGDADGTAELQRKRGGAWVGFKTVKVTDGRGSVRCPKGTRTLRAVFSGSAICAPGTSRPYTVTVK
jgi:hypothetical protein